jgi:RHS repeat-associated protein
MLVADKIDINGNSTFGITGDPYDNITVGVSPSTSLLYAGQTQQFTATTNSANTAVTWTISPAGVGTVSASGLYTAPASITTAQTVTVTATSQADTSKSSTATVTLAVHKTTPTITWATPAAIPYGTALSATQLDATSTVAGTFAYTPAVGTVLAAGLQTLSVTFTPTNTTLYNTAAATVALTVSKATPTISWATPAAITYGTALSATQLDATSTVAGTFAYTPAAGTVLAAGLQTLSVTFTPTNTTLYNTASATVTLTVSKATPTISWATPAAITYGTALSATQLDATSTVAGTFAYTPAAGTVLSAGSQTLSVTFTPTDATDYTTATSTVQLTVNQAQCVSSGYSYQRAITIDHTKVPNTDQTNFPFLFNTTDPAFATIANGGHVTSSTGNDIIFSTDPNGLTKLDHELEEYNPVTGQVIAWVRLPVLSHSTNTVLYVFYGNASITASQQNPTGVWDSNYMGVWHVANNGGQLSLVDSTSNANNATNNGATTTTGQIDGGMQTNGSTYAALGTPASLANLAQGNATFSAWVNSATGNSGAILGKNGTDGNAGWSMGLDYNNIVWFTVGGYNFQLSSLRPTSNGAWSYVTVTLDQTASQNGKVTIYVNGSPSGTGTGVDGQTTDDSSETAYLANAACGNFCGSLNGSTDEFRVSNVVRSPDWIATEFNNQNSPAVFYSVSSENRAINPVSAVLYAGQSQQFTAAQLGICSASLTWSQSPTGLGTLTSSGLYTAPSAINTQQTVTITATSQVDSTKSASATVTLEPPVAVSVTPATTALYDGSQQQQFTANVINASNTAVNWTISPTGTGTISATGLYAAPVNIASQPTVTVTATSQVDPTKSASATITLNPPVLSPPQCGSSGYSYQRAIVIDHTHIPNSDQVNFPFLFNTTDPAFATTANGGHVTSFTGNDIFFSTDPNGLTKLDHELEEYNPVTGQVIAWVRIPTLSHTTDTVLYVFYGNASITSSQQNPTGVWDSNYMGVWHVANNGGQLSLADSTSNGNNATNNGAIPTAGQIDGGMQTNGSTYATIGTPASLANLVQGNATFSAWVNTAIGIGGMIMGNEGYYAGAGWALGVDTNNNINFEAVDEGQPIDLTSAGTTGSRTWSHVVVTLTGAVPGNSSQATVYINGVPSGTVTGGDGYTLDDSSQPVYLANGVFSDGQVVTPLNGSVDEFRISNVVRSADWIATEYFNQSSPAAFYALYPENTVEAIPSTVTLYALQTQHFAVSGPGACNSAVAVTWSISPAGTGTIDATGLYTAPSSIIAQQTVTATATSQADNSTVGSSTVHLMPPVSVTVTPSSATINGWQTQQFTASVANAGNTTVMWTISPAGAGTIDQTGLYTAPSWSNIPDQVVTVTATSHADSTKSATATVILEPSISVYPASATLHGGQTQGFTVAVANAGNSAAENVIWTISPAGIGTFTPSGGYAEYIAPASFTTQQTVTITATTTTQTGTILSASGTVTLIPPVRVTPSSATLYSGRIQQFNATIGGTINSAVNWTLSPVGIGAVSATGLYTAPASITTQQTVTITATSQSDATQWASAMITLSPTQCAASGYGYQRAIVIDHTQVPNTDQVNFPFLFNTTDPAFATIANGGHVTSSTGNDIIFSTDPNGLTQLDYELEEYNPVTGQVIAWVRIPLLSHSTNTVLYVFYGNASITTSQQNPIGVWDSNYMGVWHVANNGGQLSLADSTSNANNATNNGATTTTGQIDGGMQTNGSTYATIGTPSSLANLAQGNATFSAWVNPASGTGTIMGKDSCCSVGWVLGLNNNEVSFYNVAGYSYLYSSIPMNSGAWSYVTVTLSGNPTQDGQTTIYINGLPSNSGADTSSGVSGDDSAQTAFLANDSIGVNGEPAPFNGATDEFRISNVARSADWIATEYTNQSSPATFYALYPENTVQVLPATVTLYAFQSQQFAVPGSGVCSSAAVTWAISSANLGTIDASGVYTAPTSITSQQTVTVAASTQANGATIGSATVTLMPPLSIGVTPANATVYFGNMTQQFLANVANATNTAVTWTISPAGVGTISSTGLYTSPNTYFPQQTITVTATSQTDPTKSSSAAVTLLNPPSVSVTPSNVTLNYPSQTQQFTATVTNASNTAVTWSVSSEEFGPTAVTWGTITQNGLYTAPSNFTSQQTVVVMATSQVPECNGCGMLVGTATVTLSPLDAVNVTPASATLNRGQSQQFTASVANLSNTAVTWTVNPVGLGKINSAGLYTAPTAISTQQTVTITATSQADPTKSASAMITLTPTALTPQQCWSGYSYQRAIVIDHTQVPNTDQDNFPFRFNTTDPAFATTANGGHVTSSTGNDIIFSTDPNGLIKLDHELEEYNPVTGQVIAWVRIPTLSHSTDTLLYVFYGNSSITSSQQNASGVWDSNYQAVYHFANAGTGIMADSTAYGNNATPTLTSATSGEIDGAVSFNGTSSYIQVPATTFASIQSSSAATFGTWFKTSSFGVILGQTVGEKPGSNNEYGDWPVLYIDSSGNLVASFLSGSPLITTKAYNDNQWHFVSFTTQAGTETLYVDAQSVASQPVAQFSTTSTYSYFLGAGDTGYYYLDSFGNANMWPGSTGSWFYFDGALDEVNISNIARSGDWINTQYNNQRSPSTFYALDPENAPIIPAMATLSALQSQQFVVAGTCNTAAIWTIAPSELGTISAAGLYTAPNSITTQQTVTVTATGLGNSNHLASATVTLMPPVAVSVTPTGATLTGGQTQQLTANVANTSNTAVTWTISPAGAGTISATGLYTAPTSVMTQQTTTVTATSQADTTQSASATITLSPVAGSPIPPSPTQCGSSGYSNQSTIVIDHTKVPNTDQPDFPFLFNTTDPSLATISNGGQVTSSSGYDIVFSTDPNGLTKLDHELEEYNPVTGQVIAWIRIPTLSHSADTVLYVFYGNPNITTSQQNPTGVWDRNYTAVYHLANVGTSTAADSTANGNYGTPTSVLAAPGKIDGAASFDGVSSYIQIPSADFPSYPEGTYVAAVEGTDFTATFAASFGVWFKTASPGVILSRTDGLYGGCYWFGCSYASTEPGDPGLPGTAVLYIDESGYLRGPGGVTATAYNDNNWHYAFYTVANGTETLYVDGQSLGSTAQEQVGEWSTYSYFLGTGDTLDQTAGNWSWLYFNGSLDEISISNTARSGDWAKTEYNNQSSPVTFYTFNPASTLAVAPATVGLYASQGQQFAAAGICNAAVTWSMPTGAQGMLTSSGFYTAPASITVPQNITITATSQVSGAIVGSAIVTLLPPPPPVVLTEATQPPYVIGTSQAFTATLKDQYGTPEPGVTVTFTVTGANSNIGSNTTDSNGAASYTYNGAVSGTDSIQATASVNGELSTSNSVAATWIIPAPANPEGSVTLMAPPTLGQAGLVGAFTDNTGAVIEPIAIGAAPRVYVVPAGATQLQLGVDDSWFAVGGGSGFVVAVNGISVKVLPTAMPWNWVTGGLNNNYQYGIGTALNPSGDGTSPQLAATGLTQGELVSIAYQSGTASAGLSANPPVNADGDQTRITGVNIWNGTYFPTLYMAASSYPVGQPITFNAIVVNGSGVPMPNIPVTLNVTGANAGQYQATTDSTGTAAFMYSGTNAGMDYLLAQALPIGEAGLASSQTSITWVNYPTPPPAGTLGLQYVATVGPVQGYYVTATDASGSPIYNAAVGFYETGADTLFLNGTTDITGHVNFQFSHVNSGTYNLVAIDSVNRNVVFTTPLFSGIWTAPVSNPTGDLGDALSVGISALDMVTLPNTLQLNGTYTDTLGFIPTFTWSQVSGPGTVTFATPQQQSTTATFSQAGYYLLQLSGNDTVTTASIQYAVTVIPASGEDLGQIASPVYGSSVSGVVPITLAPGITLQSGTLIYYPSSNFNNATVLNASTVGSGPMIIGTLDTTTLANGTYWIMLDATDKSGKEEFSLVQITVVGNYKPGRVTASVTDLTVPANGLPINIQRQYDSFNAGTSGDFGYGWNLGLNTDLTVDSSYNVTFTLGGQRRTFYFTPQNNSFSPILGIYLGPWFAAYTPEPGLHGTLTAIETGCAASYDANGAEALIVPNSSMWECWLGSDGWYTEGPSAYGLYNPSIYVYTDPSGTSYTISATGALQSIQDLNGNGLALNTNGITSTTGLSVPFVRDSSNRITQITDPQGNIYQYAYDANGNLASVTYPPPPTTQPSVLCPNTTQPNTSTYTYDSNHLYTGGTDARCNPLPTTNYFGSSDYDPNGLPLNGRVKSTTDALGETTSYAYNLVTNATSVKYPPDANGNKGTAVMTYDNYGMLLTSTDPLGLTTSNAYDANHNLISVTDPMGFVSSYAYDFNGNKKSSTYPNVTQGVNTTSYTTYNQYSEPTSTTDELGNVRIFNYDANYNPRSITDTINGVPATLASFIFNANETLQAGAVGYDITAQPTMASQFAYDASGNMASRTDALGRTTSYVYNSLGNKIATTLPLPNANTSAAAATTTYQYDAFGRLTQTSAPLGRTTSSTYDAMGNKTSDTDARGNVTSYQYDALNRLTTTIYPTNPVTTTTKSYDFRNNVIDSTDQAGNVTHHVYDLSGRQISVTKGYNTPQASTTSFAYDKDGRKTSVTNALGHTTSYTYDAAGRLTSIAGAKGNFTFAYDAAGNRISSADGNGNTTTFQYDARKRLVKTIYPDKTSTTNSYDGPGNLIGVTDQAGNTVNYTYDAANQLQSVIQTNSPNTANTTSYGYDPNGNLASLTDANSHSTQNVFDIFSDITGKTLPDGSLQESRTYDANGNLTQLTHFNGKTTTYAYDQLNRLTTRTPDPTLVTEPVVSYTYTPTGKHATTTVTTATASVTTSYAYDALDRLTAKVTPEGTLNYTYDASGRVASISSSNVHGASVSYTYDSLNRLSTVVDNNLPAGQNTTTYAYDSASNLVTVTYPNQLTSTIQYDSLNRLTSLNSSTVSSTQVSGYNYQLGATGNRTGATEQNGRTLTWSYDGINRLTNEAISQDPAGGNGAVSYEFDPVGNRTSANSSLPGVQTVSLSSFNLDDLLSGETYDANGNTTYTGGRSFVYDSGNRLRSMNNGAVSIIYDGFGNRVAKTVGGVTTKYLVEDDVNPTGLPQVMEETVNNVVQRTYTYGFQRISENQLINNVWTPSFYEYDGSGSVRQLTNLAANVTVTDTYNYDAFGNLLNSTGTTPNNYLYRGEQYDKDLGLYYLRARYYNPATDRFLSRDPKEGKPTIPRTLHKYLYASADPVNRVDPRGREDLIECIETCTAEVEDLELTEDVEIKDIEEAEKELCELCFAAGTPIHTDHGDVPVEKIRVGDEVVSRNSVTGKLESEPVTALTPLHKDSLLEIRIEGEHDPLRPSTRHPFWVKRGEAQAAWIESGSMRVGDQLQTLQGNWRRVVAITPLPGQETVYNFTVDKDHDYFVGETGFLVHNAGGCGCNPPLEPIRFPPEVLHPGTVTPGNPFGLFQYPATGSYGFDEQLLYEAAGIDPGSSEGWVSHHVSYNPRTGNMTGQLVDSDYHSHPHRGGVSDYENATGCEYLP